MGEVGVFTGYTTLALADAVGPEGKVYALDISKEFVDIGIPYWKKANVEGRIDLRIGPALDSLKQLEEELKQHEEEESWIDFAFVDADKSNYKNYYELLIPMMRPGHGIIALDNTLWSGKVVDPSIKDDDTIALRDITKFVAADDRVE